MPDVAFKDLCIDVTATGDLPIVVAHFWARALGQPVIDDGSLRLGPPADASKERTVWINEVPEHITGKSRVHLDVRLPNGDPAPLVAAGGTVVRAPDEDVEWYVVNDPDGIAVCVFPLRPGGDAGPFELVVDAHDPLAIAQWWAHRTGGTVVTSPDDPWVSITGAAGLPFADWVFNPVPEPKLVKNRVHWDVTLVDATADDLVAAGATVLRARDDEIGWTVLADPEGNEFCAFEQATGAA